MDIVERLRKHPYKSGNASEAADEIERLREIIANYERDHSAGAGMAPIRKLGETTVEERSRSTGFSQRSRGYGSEDI